MWSFVCGLSRGLFHILQNISLDCLALLVAAFFCSCCCCCSCCHSDIILLFYFFFLKKVSAQQKRNLLFLKSLFSRRICRQFFFLPLRSICGQKLIDSMADVIYANEFLIKKKKMLKFNRLSLQYLASSSLDIQHVSISNRATQQSASLKRQLPMTNEKCKFTQSLTWFMSHFFGFGPA